MADTSALAGLLDRAREVFHLAGELGRTFENDHKQVGKKFPSQRSPWPVFESAYNQYAEAVLTLREPMQTPPVGFESVAKVLLEAASIARRIQNSLKTRDGLAFSTFLEFWPELNSTAQQGYHAIERLEKLQRLDDRFAFLDKPTPGNSDGIDTTPTMPKPPADLIQAAARKIPVILANVPQQDDGTIGMDTAAHLVALLVKKDKHTLAAAQWAIHESVLAGRLQTGLVIVEYPSVGNPVMTSNGPKVEWHGGGQGTKMIPRKPTPFDSFKVIATDALWAWWNSPPPTNPNERTTGRFRRGGRSAISESKKANVQALHNVYSVIRAIKEQNPSWGKKTLHKHFKADKDFQNRVKEAGLKFEVKLFHAALGWIARNPSGHKTQSQNVS
jgi:hypothetical protein